MESKVLHWLLIAMLVLPASSWSQEDESEQGDVFEEESVLEEEQDFPDLVRVDETGELMDELALLEEELAADEVVSASKHRQSIFWSPLAASVYTREDLRASGANDLADFFRRVPGLDIYRAKPSNPVIGARYQADVINNRILLLVDGREELAEMSGFAYWGILSFDLDEIERLEIIRGPGSTLYGANAFNAVISVTTVPERTPSGGRVHVSAGEYGQLRLFTRAGHVLRLGGGELSLLAGVGASGHNSFADRRDQSLEAQRFHAVARYRKAGRMDVSLQAGGSFGDALINMLEELYLRDSAIPWVMAKADFALGDDSWLKTQVYHNRYAGTLHSRQELRMQGLWIADYPALTWISDTVDGQVHLETRLFGSLLLVGGGNLRYSVLEGEHIVIDDRDELRGAGFVHLEWSPWEWLQLSGGLRLDLNDFSDGMLSPRAVAVFRPWEEHSFRLGYGLAFRKPSFWESRFHMEFVDYNPAVPEIVEFGENMLGNPELNNEKLHSIEAGWRGRFLGGALSISADLFYALFRDTIDYHMDIKSSPLGIPDLDSSSAGFLNRKAKDADVGGLEAELSWQPSRAWHLWANLMLRRATNHETGDTVAQVPKVRVNLGGRYLPQSGWFFDAALHLVSAYTFWISASDERLKMRHTPELGERAFLVARLGYRVSTRTGLDLDMGVSISSPLGSPYREFTGIPMPPELSKDTLADFQGVVLHRLITFYLRGSYDH